MTALTEAHLTDQRAAERVVLLDQWAQPIGSAEQLDVVRRASQELGAENEVCPVYIANIASELRPDSDEVAEWTWMGVRSLIEAVRLIPFAFSLWIALQIPLLQEVLEADLKPRDTVRRGATAS